MNTRSQKKKYEWFTMKSNIDDFGQNYSISMVNRAEQIQYRDKQC